MENYYAGTSGNFKNGKGGATTGASPNISGSPGLNGTHKNYSYLVNFKQGSKKKKSLQQNTTYGVSYNNSESKK